MTSLAKIFNLKNRCRRIRLSNRQKSELPLGFTLLEIIISIAIIGSLIVVLLPRLPKLDTPARKITRHLMVLSKDIRNQARLSQKTFRLVISMDEKNQSYWVESAAGLVVPKTTEQLDEEAKKSDSERPKSEFQKEAKYTKKSFEMTKPIVFESVESSSQKEKQTKGLAYIYYSPQGLTESAVIQITDKKDLHWSLVVNSLTAHMELVAKAVSLKETQAP